MIKSNISGLFSRSAILAWIGFLISIGITFLLWFNARENALDNARIRFKTSTAETALEIKNRMVAYENVLQGGAALLTTVERMNRHKWHVYIQSANVAKNYPGFQGIGFAKMIHDGDLSEHIQKMRLDGLPDYRITSVGKRDDYYPIIYLEPLDSRNRQAIGYDMFSNPIRQQAMVRARDTAQAALSAKVTLIQEDERG
jgi:CHASE1-domain containing sensor protein